MAQMCSSAGPGPSLTVSDKVRPEARLLERHHALVGVVRWWWPCWCCCWRCGRRLWCCPELWQVVKARRLRALAGHVRDGVGGRGGRAGSILLRRGGGARGGGIAARHRAWLDPGWSGSGGGAHTSRGAHGQHSRWWLRLQDSPSASRVGSQSHLDGTHTVPPGSRGSGAPDRRGRPSDAPAHQLPAGDEAQITILPRTAVSATARRSVCGARGREPCGASGVRRVADRRPALLAPSLLRRPWPYEDIVPGEPQLPPGSANYAKRKAAKDAAKQARCVCAAA